MAKIMRSSTFQIAFPLPSSCSLLTLSAAAFESSGPFNLIELQ